jgi:hypothetical protein
MYVTGGRFAALLSGHIQRNGNEVFFRATLSTGQGGVFLGNGLTTTTIATTGDTYSAFTRAAVNDAGLVAFMANLTAGGQAIATGDGTHRTTIADTSGPFSSFFGYASINNDGQVVFTANLAAGGSGIFSIRDGVVDEIIGTGDSLFGSTVTSFGSLPFAPQGLNNLGQLGFAAHLADGRTVLARADLDGAKAAGPASSASIDALFLQRMPEVSPMSVKTIGQGGAPSTNASARLRLPFGEDNPHAATDNGVVALVSARNQSTASSAREHAFSDFGDWLNDARIDSLTI